MTKADANKYLNENRKAIAKAENFEVFKEEIEAEYARLAEAYKIDVEKAKATTQSYIIF